MLSCIKGRQCDPKSGKTDKECGHNLAYAYFVSFIFFCSFLVSRIWVKYKISYSNSKISDNRQWSVLTVLIWHVINCRPQSLWFWHIFNSTNCNLFWYFKETVNWFDTSAHARSHKVFEHMQSLKIVEPQTL